jgi:hypothetical protein
VSRDIFHRKSGAAIALVMVCGLAAVLCKIVFPEERKSGRDMVMMKADTRKVKVVRDDALIVAVDIGMEMNRGYCTTQDGRSTKIFKFENTRAGMDTL